MTIEDLSRDNTFLEGLRNGNFCLVLGAGFSFGLSKECRIRNKTNHINLLYANIPLTSEFIDITKLEFPGTNTVQFSDAVQLWENAIKTDSAKSQLFRDLFRADETHLREKILTQYKNILIPNWYRVFTFNFDDVFEQICADEYCSLAYPDDKEFKSITQKQIAHVHGIITADSDLQKLVFFGNKYAELQKSSNDLYYALLNSVSRSQNKGLVVVGCRFNETIQIQKFYSEIDDNLKPSLYHFSTEQPTISGGTENIDYKFIQSSTADFLNFINEHRTQIENIQIDGTITVTKEFIKEVEQKGNSNNYSSADFYLAKQVDECQWYGVTQNWVVERKNYRDIKEEVISSFTDTKRASKISALVWGKGGSGKSTLLRKLAVDLCCEEFAVLWVIDKEMQRFYEKGLAQLREYHKYKSFLIIIEDLYRVKQQDVKLKEIIDAICSYNNVRLIVGDRKRDDASLKEHVYNPDKNIFELTVDDNRETLKRLLENITTWKRTAELLLTTDEDYKSTLYYILWTIGRTAQKNEEDISTFGNEDLTSHFRSLVESDLKALSVNYPGVARMLHYWASIYKTSKIYIAYDLFFRLAELFSAPSISESKLLPASPTNKSILDIYIHKATGFIKSAGELPLLAFNQDILAEEGLSKVQLDGWYPFDNSVKLAMLPIIIDEGDDFSSSNFLFNCLRYIPDSEFSKNEKKKYVNKLKAKGNFNIYLIVALTKDFYTEREKIELSDEILARENFWKLPHQVVGLALNISKDKEKADKIFEQQNFWNLPFDLVSTALNISKDREKAYKILEQENFWNLPHQIVSTALNISKDKEKADEILAQDNFWNLPNDIVSTALNISKDKDKADEILAQDNFWTLPHQIVSTALNISKDKDKADEILAQDNFWNLPNALVSIALNISKDKDKADEILAQDNFWTLPHQIVSTALNISKDKDKADEILSQDNFWNLPNALVSTALNISKDKADKLLSEENFWNLDKEVISTALNISNSKELKERVAKALFESGQWRDKWSITYHILQFYSQQKDIPKQIKEICSLIIAEFFDRKNYSTGKYLRYITLMKIPFHTITYWKQSSSENIRRWENRNRGLVTNTIIAYTSHPAEIRNMCKAIMNNWETELDKEIDPRFVIGRKGDLHYGNHIRFSLGHPDLRSIAAQTARKIKEAELKSAGIIPEHLLKTVYQIIDENIFLWGADGDEIEY